jgi:hypothetical protein
VNWRLFRSIKVRPTTSVEECEIHEEAIEVNAIGDRTESRATQCNVEGKIELCSDLQEYCS